MPFLAAPPTQPPRPLNGNSPQARHDRTWRAERLPWSDETARGALSLAGFWGRDSSDCLIPCSGFRGAALAVKYSDGQARGVFPRATDHRPCWCVGTKQEIGGVCGTSFATTCSRFPDVSTPEADIPPTVVFKNTTMDHSAILPQRKSGGHSNVPYSDVGPFSK